jgi:hypothetical protein
MAMPGTHFSIDFISAGVGIIFGHLVAYIHCIQVLVSTRPHWDYRGNTPPKTRKFSGPSIDMFLIS